MQHFLSETPPPPRNRLRKSFYDIFDVIFISFALVKATHAIKSEEQKEKQFFDNLCTKVRDVKSSNLIT